jgi:hypothetical protein
MLTSILKKMKIIFIKWQHPKRNLIFVRVKNKKEWGLRHSFSWYILYLNNFRPLHIIYDMSIPVESSVITLNDVTSVTKSTCKTGYFMGVLHAMRSEESMIEGGCVLCIIAENFNCNFHTRKCVQFYTASGRILSDH